MLYKRNVTKKPLTLWQKLYRPVIFLAVAILALIFSSLEKDDNEFSYPLKKLVGEKTVVTYNNSIQIVDGATITFKDVSFLETFLYPTRHFITDRFYMLSAIIICCILIYLIYTETKNGVFTNNILKYTKVLTAIFSAMFILNALRWFYIKTAIKDVTNNEYKLFGFIDQFYWPEFWLMVVLGVITYILRKGEKLQEEQDLTV